MSRVAIKAMLDVGCRCSKDDDPDDMILGACMAAAGVKMVHHDGFHQVSLDGLLPFSFWPGYQYFASLSGEAF